VLIVVKRKNVSFDCFGFIKALEFCCTLCSKVDVDLVVEHKG
jgi:hypothetical protein